MVALATTVGTAACSGHSGSTASPPIPTDTPSVQPSVSTPPAASPAKLRRFYRQQLTWHGCGTGLDCTTLTVPIDYAKPSGATLGVAVIRKHATGSRRGSLIVNPGGPGGSGVDFVRSSADAFAQLTDHYDLVGFDPRGVGGSKPVRCVSSSQLDAYVATDPDPQTQAVRRESVVESRHFAAACFRRNGNYLRHIGTIDAARDMDVLRAALGDTRLTYYGASYGTYMGAKYAQLFPRHIRALVLDGALDPAISQMAGNRVQATGFETDLKDFLGDCVKSNACPLGNSDSSAVQGLDRLIASVRARHVPAGTRTLGPGEFFEGLASGLYSPNNWVTLRGALKEAMEGDGRGMLLFSDALTERHADGSYANLIESNIAINCIDKPWPRQVSAYVKAAQVVGRLAPHFGAPIEYGSLNCAFWKVPPVEQAHPVHAAGAPPILVIGTTRDPATPYVWAQALAKQLASGVLLTYTGDGHTAYLRGNGCISAAVKAYVESLQPPKAGARCS